MKVRIDENCSIHYERRGAGPAILMIQGVGVQGDGWLPQVDQLASHFTCITFDHRGIGQSQWRNQGDLTVDRLALDALAVLEASGFSSAHVIGHSLGGTVALALALHRRDAVESLSLLCTFPSGTLVAPLTVRMMWLGIRATMGTRRMRRRGFLGIVMPPGPLVDSDALADRMSQLFGHDIADQPPIAKKQLRALKQAELTHKIDALSGIPTLVLSGKHDPIGPPTSGKEIARRIQGSQYVEFADASHGLPITHADRVNAQLLEFLRR